LSIRLDLQLDVWLVVDLLLADFAADCIYLGDGRHDFLEFGVDLSELLLALLFAKLGTHLLLKLFFSALPLLLQLFLLLLHHQVELLAFLRHLLSCLFAIITSAE